MPLPVKYDLPINFIVYSTSESDAEITLLQFLNKAIKEFEMQNEITDYELFEFIPEHSCCRRGNDDSLEGQSIQSKEQAVPSGNWRPQTDY